MSVSEDVIIACTRYVLSKSLYDYLTKSNWHITTHIILDRLYPEARNITSRMCGLQTSLGTFWEKLAKVLLKINHCVLIDPKSIKEPILMPKAVEDLKQAIMNKREQNGGSLNDLRQGLDNLTNNDFKANTKSYKIPKGKGADLIFKKGGKTYICDTKTVQVNANNGNTFNETAIIWLCYYKVKTGLPASVICPCFVFPYNSSNELDDSGWWSEFGDRVKPLTKQEVFVGNEFWSLITDNPKALSSIIKGIDSLRDSDEIKVYREFFACDTKSKLISFSNKVKRNFVRNDDFEI